MLFRSVVSAPFSWLKTPGRAMLPPLTIPSFSRIFLLLQPRQVSKPLGNTTGSRTRRGCDCGFPRVRVWVGRSQPPKNPHPWQGFDGFDGWLGYENKMIFNIYLRRKLTHCRCKHVFFLAGADSASASKVNSPYLSHY